MQNTSAVDGMHVVMTFVTMITTDSIKPLHFVVELGLASLHVACGSM